MDRRQKRTQASIWSAFLVLIQRKKYEEITVQDIIDTADIGRSTFYSHYSTKEELLESMVNQVFEYVFPKEMLTNRTHEQLWIEQGLENSLLRLLVRIREGSLIVKALLAGNSRNIYLQRFAETMFHVFDHFIDPVDAIPYDFRLNQAVKSFIDTVIWWVDNDLEIEPEVLLGYYFETNLIGFSNR